MNGLFAGATRLPGLFGDPMDRMPSGVLARPGAPAINAQPIPVAPRALPAREPARVQQMLATLGRGAGQAFGGMDDPRLSAEENARARNAALIRAGLTMMAASGSGAAFGQSLATGALAGMDAGTQGREAQIEAERRKRAQRVMQQAMGGGVDVPTMRKMLQEALAAGDIESAKVLAQVIPSMESAEARAVAKPEPAPTIRVAGRDFPNTEEGAAAALKWTRDYAAANRISGGGGGGGGGGASSYQYKEINGEPYNYDNATGTLIPIPGAPPVRTATGANTDGARRAAGLLGVIQDANAVIENYKPTPRDRLGAVPFVGNDMLSDEGQVAAQAARQLAQSYLYVVSGAQATTSEIDATAKTYLPLPSDSPATLARKRQARAAAMQAVRSVAGMQPAASAPAGGFDDLIPASVGEGRNF